MNFAELRTLYIDAGAVPLRLDFASRAPDFAARERRRRMSRRPAACCDMPSRGARRSSSRNAV
jgi:hypothetical protein